jgi:hypothetical protein
VLAPVDLGEPAIGGRERGDPGLPQERWQALLQGAEQALHAPASLRGIGGDVLDPELLEGPPDLGQAGLVDLLAGLRGDEVMAAAIGVERTEQALRGNRLLKPLQARGGALLFDQKERGDRAGGIVQGDDQIKLRSLR